MSLPFFSADDVMSAVSMQEAIDAMEIAFSSVANKTAQVPLRIDMPIVDRHACHGRSTLLQERDLYVRPQ